MNNLNYEDVVTLHVETFGVPPVTTGMGYALGTPLIDRVVNAITSGVPYIEQPLPEGTST